MAHNAPQARSNTLRLERWYPFLTGAMTTLVLWTLNDDLKKTIATDLVVPILTILPIIIGFLIASLTLLYTIQDTEDLKRLKSSSAFKQLVDYHVAGVGLGSAAAIFALAVLVVCKPDNAHLVPSFWRAAYFYTWLLLTSWSFAAFLRVVFLLRSLMVG